MLLTFRAIVFFPIHKDLMFRPNTTKRFLTTFINVSLSLAHFLSILV